jgi:hypothetical protein
MALEVVKKEISLNVGQPNNFELICAMQGDNKSFEITATLYDVNKLYTINTDNIKLKGVNPLGSNLYKDVKGHTANTVTFALTEDMLAYDGLLKLVLVLAESSTQLTTFPFVIKVVNSPGNTNADDMQTVSALVEEAKKWAMLSKSYAVGTDNEVRKGDAKDNSKYYYEQIKELYDSGKIGNGKILYFETYEEFKKELDAGKIENETLICIKEGDGGGNSGGSSGGNTEDDKKPIDFNGKSLILYKDYINIYETTDMNTWNNAGYKEHGYHYIPFSDSNKYSVAYCNDMIFAINETPSRNNYLNYTIRDFRNIPNSETAWYFSTSGKLNSFGKMAYGNGHLIVVELGNAYVIDDDTILSNRKSKDLLSLFKKMSGCDDFRTPTAMAYGNNIFVITYDYAENSTTIASKSFYTSDYLTWHELNGCVFVDYLDQDSLKMVYGNGLFLILTKSFNRGEGAKLNNIRILDSNNLSSGWINPKDQIPYNEYEDSNTIFTDIIFNDRDNKFYIPFFNERKNTSGFYIYDCTSWSRNDVNKLIKLYNCIFYQGKLFGFTEDNHWISVDNFETYQYTDYGIIETPIDSFPFSDNTCSYILLDKPLWNIDDNTIEGNKGGSV